MKKDLIIRLRNKMNQTHTGVTALADLTGIPKARIYKWLDEKSLRPSSPKTDDATILEKWINGEKLEIVPRGTLDKNEKKEPDKETENEYLRKRVRDLEKIISLQERIIEDKKENLPPMESAKSAG